MHASLIPVAIGGACLALYARGVAVLWRGKKRRVVGSWHVASFAAGWLIILLAIASPLHELAEQMFSAHMIQHEVLMVIAAPLLVLGRPVVMLWALPRAWRPGIKQVSRNRGVRGLRATFSRPFDAWLLHAVVIWIWHLPALFDAALRSEAVHAMQHLSFVSAALLFWWTIVHPARRSERGISILSLFTTAVHTGVLGALMTFARAPWYSPYGERAASWGLTPLGDQQLAGMIMWIPASVVYLVAALLAMRKWLGDSNWRTTPDDRHAYAISVR
jgi:putative membrane protein